MPDRRSGGSLTAAFCSLFIPGLGQFLQGYYRRAFFYLVLWLAIWMTLGAFGLVMHLWAALDAAKYHFRW